MIKHMQVATTESATEITGLSVCIYHFWDKLNPGFTDTSNSYLLRTMSTWSSLNETYSLKIVSTRYNIIGFRPEFKNSGYLPDQCKHLIDLASMCPEERLMSIMWGKLVNS